MNLNIHSLLGAALLCLGAPSTVLPQSWNSPNGGALPAGCQHRTYFSAANNATIGYNIYLPPDYAANTSARYPVVYSLHGMGGNEWGNLGYATALQSGINSKTINPMIMVFVNGRSNTFYADAKDGSVKCETTLIKELIPHIDSAFRTVPDRAHRAANGISMGGFGALMLATKHHELFGHATSVIAALVNWDTLSAQQFDQSIPTRIFGSDSAYFNGNYYPPTFVKKNAAILKASGSKFRMADNPGDVSMGPLYSYNVSMRNLLKANGIPVEFDSTAGNGHVADYTGRSGVAILKFHSDAFAAATVSLGRGPAFGHAAGASDARLTAMGDFTVPKRWQSHYGEVAIHSPSGRRLGRESIDGVTVLYGGTLAKRYGGGILMVKPIAETTKIRLHP
jgi:enterochelin esterase-like enzyme